MNATRCLVLITVSLVKLQKYSAFEINIPIDLNIKMIDAVFPVSDRDLTNEQYFDSKNLHNLYAFAY